MHIRFVFLNRDQRPILSQIGTSFVRFYYLAGCIAVNYYIAKEILTPRTDTNYRVYLSQ